MIFLIVYITILFSLESMSVAAGVWIVEEIYVNNRDYPGGPWAYFLATQNQPENVLFAVSTFLLTFLSDLLVVSLVTTRSCAFLYPPFQIWRCWVIWNSSGRPVAYAMTAFPTALLLASAGD